MYRGRRLIIANQHSRVSRMSLPSLVNYFGEGARTHGEYLRKIAKGSTRPCKRTCFQCPYCPVNWDCRTLKAERVKLGWRHDE